VNDLCSFLLDRIAESEAVAQRVLEDGPAAVEHAMEVGADPVWTTQDAKVRRQLVLTYQSLAASEPMPGTFQVQQLGVYTKVIRQLASAYSEHAVYRDEWRP